MQLTLVKRKCCGCERTWFSLKDETNFCSTDCYRMTKGGSITGRKEKLFRPDYLTLNEEKQIILDLTQKTGLERRDVVGFFKPINVFQNATA